MDDLKKLRIDNLNRKKGELSLMHLNPNHSGVDSGIWAYSANPKEGLRGIYILSNEEAAEFNQLLHHETIFDLRSDQAGVLGKVLLHDFEKHSLKNNSNGLLVDYITSATLLSAQIASVRKRLGKKAPLGTHIVLVDWITMEKLPIMIPVVYLRKDSLSFEELTRTMSGTILKAASMNPMFNEGSLNIMELPKFRKYLEDLFTQIPN